MRRPGLTITTWATQQGYARPDRPAADALVIPRETDLAFDFAEIDSDGFPVFELLPSRALDTEAVYYTGVNGAGFPYVNPAGVTPGEEATVSIDEDGFLDFTLLEA